MAETSGKEAPPTDGTSSSDIENRLALVSFSHDAVVEGLKSFYAFLERLSPAHQGKIQLPPPGGWPEITNESLSELNKTATVIHLLKHMPYIEKLKYHDGIRIIPKTLAIPYNDVPWVQSLLKGGGPNVSAFNPMSCPDPYLKEKLPPHVVLIAQGTRNSYSVYIDTERWAIYWVNNMDITAIPDGTLPMNTEGLDPEGPMWWKFAQSWSPSEFFEMWKGYFRDCWFLPHPGGEDDIWETCFIKEEIVDELELIYRKHGWPEEGEGYDFRRDEASKEIRDWYDKKVDEGLL